MNGESFTIDNSKPGRRNANSDLDADFVDESHIQAFAHALYAEDNTMDQGMDPGSPAIPNSPIPRGSRIRKVSALSDFAPVNVKVHKRAKRDRHNKRTDWLFLLLRWPLLGFIFIFIAAEFGLYVLIRQLVNTKEWISAWRGQKGVLRKRLRASRNYEEWKQAAQTLDQYLNFNDWKVTDEDSYYDWMLVRKVRKSLRNLREKKDTRGLLGVLETCIRNNFAGVESSRLYSETFLGTKDLIESYYNEQEKALEFIRNAPDISEDEKRRFFKSVNTNLGTSALCLSGGGSFGYYHFGVVKAFLDADLLPRVITGTSAGGLIAALVCTRTDAELKRLLVPELANRITACEEPIRIWMTRFLKTGARFDSVSWARKSAFFTRGSMTFKEAYYRTGRILNISVVPADRHSPTKLLNYLTAPDTIIWSALLASAAVPGILNPVVLMSKLKDGSIVPWSWGSRFKDGSLRVDIPVQALNLYFNVTHPVVSQVNPHVHLFFFAPRGSAGKPVAHSKGKGWRGNFLLSAAEQWLKHELTKNFKVIRDLELLPQLLGQDWSSVFLQRFDGAVTIWPRTRFWDWIRILSDPDPLELERMMRVGQLVTWPKLHMIGNRYRIEKQIFLGRQAVRRSVRSRSRVRPANDGSANASLQEPSTGTRLPTESVSKVALDKPLSMDTDMENAYFNGSGRFLRRRPSNVSLQQQQQQQQRGRTSNHDLRSSPGVRRQGHLELLDPNPRPATPDPPPDARTNETLKSPKSGSFFSRLRTPSFASLPSPFSASPRSLAKEPSRVLSNDNWSSDSSEDDVIISGHAYHPSITAGDEQDIDVDADSDSGERRF